MPTLEELLLRCINWQLRLLERMCVRRIRRKQDQLIRDGSMPESYRMSLTIALKQSRRFIATRLKLDRDIWPL
jgi:hypothetical protein